MIGKANPEAIGEMFKSLNCSFDKSYEFEAINDTINRYSGNERKRFVGTVYDISKDVDLAMENCPILFSVDAASFNFDRFIRNHRYGLDSYESRNVMQAIKHYKAMYPEKRNEYTEKLVKAYYVSDSKDISGALYDIRFNEEDNPNGREDILNAVKNVKENFSTSNAKTESLEELCKTTIITSMHKNSMFKKWSDGR